jgi:hypothetical protein
MSQILKGSDSFKVYEIKNSLKESLESITGLLKEDRSPNNHIHELPTATQEIQISIIACKIDY